MGGVAKAVSSVVGDAIETVGDAVEDVGDFVVDKVVEPVVKTVDNTIKAAQEDPLGTIVKVAAIATMNPAIIAAANAAVAVAHGASLEDAAKVAAVSYAASSIGAEVGGAGDQAAAATQYGTELGSSQTAMLAAQEAGMGSAVDVAGNVLGRTAAATVTGQDPVAALITNGASAATAEIASGIEGYDQLSKTQQAAVNQAIAKTLVGKDPSQTLINEAIAAGVDAMPTKDSAPSSELMGQTGFKPEVAPDESYWSDIGLESPNAFKPEAAPDDSYWNDIGIDQSSLSTMPSSNEDPLAFLNSRGDYDEITGQFVYDENGTLPGPLDNTSGTNLSSMDGYEYDPLTQTWKSPDGTVTDLSYLSNTMKPLDTGSLDYLNPKETSIGQLAKSLLKDANQSGDWGSLGALGALGLGGAAVAADSGNTGYTIKPWDLQNQNVNWNAGQLEGPQNGVAFGQAQLSPEFVNAAQGGIMSLNHYAMGGGVKGISSLGGYAAGGNPRLLRGPGDGMSDNIPASIAGRQPARLADGEFVIPADVVSHLGNGSTEAGANVLSSMMERVRKARTGNPKQGKQINPAKFVPTKGK